MKKVFVNRFGELRMGWQIVLFLLVFALAIAPAVILLNLKDNFVAAVISLVGAFVATFVMVRFVNGKPFVAVGLAVNKQTMRQLGLGCLIGWLMMTCVFGIEYLCGYVKVVASENVYDGAVRIGALSVAFFAVAALFEEIMFRGYPFQTLVRGIKFIPATIVMGALFGLVHLRNPNASVFGFLNTFLVAVLFCFAYWRTRALWLPFGIHFAWNFAQTTLYGFPTSGLHFSNFELTRLTQFGPEWLTGGAYGPEGGVLATLTIVLCAVYLYYSEFLQPAQGTVTLEREDERLDTQILDRRAAA